MCVLHAVYIFSFWQCEIVRAGVCFYLTVVLSRFQRQEQLKPNFCLCWDSSKLLVLFVLHRHSSDLDDRLCYIIHRLALNEAALLETGISRPVAGLGSVKNRWDVSSKSDAQFTHSSLALWWQVSHDQSTHPSWIIQRMLMNSFSSDWFRVMLSLWFWGCLGLRYIIRDYRQRFNFSTTMEGVGALSGVNGSRLWKDLKSCHIIVEKEWTEVNEYFNIYRVCSVHCSKWVFYQTLTVNVWRSATVESQRDSSETLECLRGYIYVLYYLKKSSVIYLYHQEINIYFTFLFLLWTITTWRINEKKARKNVKS